MPGNVEAPENAPAARFSAPFTVRVRDMHHNAELRGASICPAERRAGRQNANGVMMAEKVTIGNCEPWHGDCAKCRRLGAG